MYKKGSGSDCVSSLKVGIPALTIAQYPKDINANSEENVNYNIENEDSVKRNDH